VEVFADRASEALREPLIICVQRIGAQMRHDAVKELADHTDVAQLFIR
jgi:hypothetical protein